MRQYVELGFMRMNPDDITEILSVQPTTAHKAGEERVPGAIWKYDSWALRSGVIESELDAAKHFSALFSILGGRGASIRELAKRVDPVISWVVNVCADEQTPIGVIPCSVLAKIAEIGADLNVSMYFDSENMS